RPTRSGSRASATRGWPRPSAIATRRSRRRCRSATAHPEITALFLANGPREFRAARAALSILSETPATRPTHARRAPTYFRQPIPGYAPPKTVLSRVMQGVAAVIPQPDQNGYRPPVPLV